MRTMFRGAAVVAALTLLAVSCGDDDDTEAGAEPPADSVAEPAADTDETDHDSEDMAPEDGDHDHEADHDDGDHDHEADHEDGDHDHEADHDDEGSGGEHDHDTTHEAVAPVPAIEVVAVPDPAAGLNVFVTTSDFTVSPESASTDHVDGEGHFHLYVDGEKRLRFYNEEIHVEGIPEGEVEIMVELSANDHGAYTSGGEPIVATTTVTIPPHDHGSHDHGEPEPAEFTGDAPDLALEVLDDPKSGWNAFIELDGFELSAENASSDHVDGEGHIHLYVDDLKLMRLYGTAAHLSTLPEGEHEIRVELFTNDHRPYVIDGVPVGATTTVTVAA